MQVEMLQQMDGMGSRAEGELLMVLATTNKPWVILSKQTLQSQPQLQPHLVASLPHWQPHCPNDILVALVASLLPHLQPHSTHQLMQFQTRDRS